MEKLKRIINAFHPLERETLSGYYELGLKKRSRKRGELLKLLLKQPDLSEEQACQALYGKDRSTAFIHLKKELTEDVLEVLMLSNKLAQSPMNVNYYECCKKTMQGRVLTSRTLLDEGMDLLLEALEMADRFEYYTVMPVIYSNLLTSLSLKKDWKRYKEYGERLDHALEVTKDLHRSNVLSKSIALPGFGKYHHDSKREVQAAEALAELGQIKDRSSSAMIHNLWYKSGIFYYELVHDYAQALTIAEEFAEYIVDKPPIYLPSNYAGIQMQIAKMHTLLNNYDKAVEHAKEARANFKTGKMGHLSSLKILFYALLRAQRYEEAEEVMEEALKHRSLHVNVFNPALWDQMHAALLFERRDFDSCVKILNQSSALKKDRSGYYLGNRLLELICQIEIGNYDIFEIKLKAYRQLFKSIKKEAGERDALLIKLLAGLMKYGFNFRETVSASQELLKQLADDKVNHWDPLGYEIVRVDDWLLAKANQRSASAA